jgi:hypothetical protein
MRRVSPKRRLPNSSTAPDLYGGHAPRFPPGKWGVSYVTPVVMLTSAEGQTSTQHWSGTAISPRVDQSSCGIVMLTIRGVSAR